MESCHIMRQNVYSETNIMRYLGAFAVLVIVCCADLCVGFAQSNMQLLAQNDKVGQLSVYEYRFTTTDSLYVDAEIKLTFPESFSIATVKLAHSAQVNGGIHIEIEEQNLILKRTGLGNVLPPGQNVIIGFANVRNPAEANSYTVDISMKPTASTTVTVAISE